MKLTKREVELLKSHNISDDIINKIEESNNAFKYTMLDIDNAKYLPTKNPNIRLIYDRKIVNITKKKTLESINKDEYIIGLANALINGKTDINVPNSRNTIYIEPK